MTTPPGTHPGWYADPDDPAAWRYWDGSSWTAHRAGGDAAPSPARPGGTRRGRLVLLAGLGLFGGLGIGAVVVASSGGEREAPHGAAAVEEATTTTVEAERVAEEAIEDAAGFGEVDVDDEGEVSFESEEGSVSFGSGELPEDFPEGLFVPDGYEVVSTVTAVQDETTSSVVSLTGPGVAEQVHAKAMERVAAAGFGTADAFEDTLEGAFTGSFSFDDGAGLAGTYLTATDTAAPGAVVITIFYERPS